VVLMTKVEDKIKEIWNKEPVKDATIITGVTIAEQVTENILLRNVKPEYHTLTKTILNAGSNAVSYFLGKSQQKKYTANNTQNQNGQQPQP